MLKQKTVFIIGAGASSEAKLPMGAQLMSKIRTCIDVKYRYGNELESGNRLFAAALRTHTSPDGRVESYNDHLAACWQLRDGLGRFPLSIDTYLDTHADNEKMVLSGKLAIATCIAEAEATSILVIDNSHANAQLNFSGLANSWYPSLQELLFSGVKRTEVKSVFQNVSFITFNYDRCIEHFLFNALKGYFHIDSGAAKACMEGLRIHHVYGAIAPLDWQDPENGVAFGRDISPQNLISAASRIRLFTERYDQKEALQAYRTLISEADTIVFLGFSFQTQNLEILKTKIQNRNIHIYGTAHGISEIDAETISTQINLALGGKKLQRAPILKTKWKCKDLFDELHHTLRGV